MSESRRTKVLVGVLAVLGVFLLWRQFSGGGSGSTSEAESRAARQNARGRSAAVPEREVGEVVRLELERLEHRPAEYSPGRSLFQYQRAAPAAARNPELAADPKPRVERAERPLPVQPPRPKPPPIDLEFLGSFGPEGRRIAVFTDKTDILNALEGDVLNDKFIVGPIGYESVEMGFVGFPDVPPKRIGVGG